MNSELIQILLLISAVSCGLTAGVFFAFSNFIMKAFNRIPAVKAIDAMQSINITVINPLFMFLLFGTGLVCIALIIISVSSWHQPNSIYILAGSLSYLLGSIVVTIFFNVPLNNKLALISPEGSEGDNLWTNFSSSWTAWNHVRTIFSTISAIVFIVSLYY